MMIKALRSAAAVVMAAVSALALAVLGPAGTASAGVLDLTCTPPSSNNSTFNPPLTMAPQTVTFNATAQYGPCVSLSNPAITSGSRTTSGVVPELSCLDLLGTGSPTLTITWNTGQSSIISGNNTSTIVGATLVSTYTGTVTSGLFAGSTVVHVNAGPAADVLLCTAGLGTVAGIYSVVPWRSPRSDPVPLEKSSPLVERELHRLESMSG